MAGKRRSNGQGTLFQRVAGGPWVAAWFDHTGKRRIRSTRTTDRRTAERLLAKYVADAALRRDGVVDPKHDRFSAANRVPLTKHVDAYIEHCRHAGHVEKHIIEKVRHLKTLLDGIKATRLSELTAEAVEKHMWAMKAAGKAARTANFTRQVAIAFANWCAHTGRVEVNPLAVVAKQDERKDRRRIRRPVTDDELTRLLAVAEPRGRKPWYMAAALAGLRKGDLQHLRWADVDFAAGTITIRDGKARREDVVPMHPQLADELLRLRDSSPVLPQDRVFHTTVTDATRLKDFLRAGIARREVVTDAEGEPVMVGKGKRQRPRTRIVTEDAEGRVVDLHALRTWLGTKLARAGVAPQLAQRIMRHADYRTTLKHYTILGVVDLAKAIDALPPIREAESQAMAATGTCANDGRDGLAPGLEKRNIPTSPLRSSSREPGRGTDGSGSYSASSSGTKRRDVVRPGATGEVTDRNAAEERKPLTPATLREALRDGATACDGAGEGIRTLDVQLGKLTLYH